MYCQIYKKCVSILHVCKMEFLCVKTHSAVHLLVFGMRGFEDKSSEAVAIADCRTKQNKCPALDTSLPE